MSTDLAVLMLIIFIGLYFTIIEIFTVLFILTGLPESKARFQVISMLTNSGFTTTESEIITSSRKRRKLAMLTMLFGYTFTVLIVSMLLNFIISIPKRSIPNLVRSVTYVFIFAAGFYSIYKLPSSKTKFYNTIRKIGSRIMFSKNANTFLVLDNYGENVIAEMILVDLPPILKDKTLAESQIRNKYSIQILAIRSENATKADITGEEVIKEKDRIILFGPMKNINEVFNQKPSF